MTSTTTHTNTISALKRSSREYTRHSKTEANLAKRQLRTLGITAILGVVLIILVPRMIHEADYALRKESLPINVLTDVSRATDAINRTYSARREELATNLSEVAEEISTAKSAQNETKQRLVKTTNELETALRHSGTVFRSSSIAPELIGLTQGDAIRTTAGKFLLASTASSRRQQTNPKIAILESHDAVTWMNSTAIENDVTLHGSLHTIVETSNRILMVGGEEYPKEGRSIRFPHSQMIILRREENEQWKIIRPVENKQRILGSINTMTELSDKYLFATATERSMDSSVSRHILFLTSKAGFIWSPFRPTDNNTTIEGELEAVVQTTDETLLAVGYEKIDIEESSLKADGVILLRSPNALHAEGASWEVVRPMINGKRILGRLTSIIQTNDGEFLAGGVYQNVAKSSLSYPRKAMLLRSTDGISWMPVNLENLGGLGRSFIHSIRQHSDGTIFAVGRQIIQGLRSQQEAHSSAIPVSVLLRSVDGITWTRVQSSSHARNDGGDEGGGFSTLLEGPNGMVAIGSAPTLWESIPHLTIPEGQRVATASGGEGDQFVDSNVLRLVQREIELTTEEARVLRKIESLKTNENVWRIESEELDGINEIFDQIVETLQESLQKSDEFREMGLIAARIAILGLVAYFIQIMVTRYRYHAVLSKFYESRALALSLFAADGGGVNCFRGSELKDLVNALSPDKIGFGKVGDSALVNVSSILGEKRR